MAGETVAPPEAGTAVERALEALRLDWGNLYLVGYDDEHGWYASRHGRVGGLLEGNGPDELRAAIAADYGPARASQLWCTGCGKRVTADTPVPVHAASGRRTGAPDGHLADPVAEEPPLWRAARRIAADYGGAFTVTARFGILRADWSPWVTGSLVTAAHYAAAGEDGPLAAEADLRRQLDEAVKGTHWERAAIEAAP